jgi:prepilin-type N-terminal cleavage/methylation domain-containing protein
MTVAVRRGVTLVELVVALALFGVVAAIMLTIVRQQQRFHIGSLEIIETKRSAQQAIDVLYGELRAASSADLYSVSDSSIAFRTTLGTSHICSIDAARTAIVLPRTGTGRASPLSAFLAMPRAGDSLLILDPGDPADGDDDRWHPHVLTTAVSGGTCPLRPFGLAATAIETAGLAVGIAPALTRYVVVGAPARFFRPATFSLYRSTGAAWMLGYSSCAAGACTARQPLSGPYLPFATGGAGGVAFEYFDRDGASTADPSGVARIGIIARARSTSTLDVGHLRRQRYHDSLAVTISLRNSS